MFKPITYSELYTVIGCSAICWSGSTVTGNSTIWRHGLLLKPSFHLWIFCCIYFACSVWRHTAATEIKGINKGTTENGIISLQVSWSANWFLVVGIFSDGFWHFITLEWHTLSLLVLSLLSISLIAARLSWSAWKYTLKCIWTFDTTLVSSTEIARSFVRCYG